MSVDFDSTVVGAGVIGLAVARALAESGRTVLLVEREDGIGQGISSRNSEVIHAGIYYPNNSLKHVLCIEGKRLLVNYCRDRDVDYKLLGKLIVATDKHQIMKLSTIMQNGRRNGVSDLRLVDSMELTEMEPNLKSKKAILSPSTGILDSHGFMLSLLGDIEKSGAVISFRSAVSQVRPLKQGFAISISGYDDFEFTSKELVNSAGLHAQEMSEKILGIDKASIPKAFYCKGTYFSFRPPSPFKRLIYPVPSNAGLGVHLTLDLAGRAKFGPDTEWISRPDYVACASNKDKFWEAIRKYYPEIKKEDLNPDYAGVRPKIVGAESLAADFSIQFENEHSLKGYVALYGMESPGLTASLAVANYVVAQLDSQYSSEASC
jgi:L-2-hydroxyglutarate oxidase LhgO